MASLTIAAAAFLATMAGGLIALRLRDRLHLILGFSAGAVVGVAFLDLLPEALRMAPGDPAHTMLWVAGGFLFYLLLDRVALLHSHDEGHGHAPPRGAVGAIILVAHSVFDGLAIGFSFQVSAAVGVAVAIAVITHDFSDGINTMSVVLKNGGARGDGLRWLFADALAPTVGVALTFLVHPAGFVFATILAVFAGLFFYLGASDLVPESQHAHPKILTTAMTVLGAGAVYLASTLAS
jgi:ZIP family zinc transporter